MNPGKQRSSQSKYKQQRAQSKHRESTISAADHAMMWEKGGRISLRRGYNRFEFLRSSGFLFVDELTDVGVNNIKTTNQSPIKEESEQPDVDSPDIAEEARDEDPRYVHGLWKMQATKVVSIYVGEGIRRTASLGEDCTTVYASPSPNCAPRALVGVMYSNQECKPANLHFPVPYALPQHEPEPPPHAMTRPRFKPRARDGTSGHAGQATC
ncbi:hypothetical protein BDQ17DRAFT_1329249 [Cyathus striatus]|nr:hypothetical protein BDQ17DRAFT_1329249 [Cyathus striatus]